MERLSSPARRDRWLLERLQRPHLRVEFVSRRRLDEQRLPLQPPQSLLRRVVHELSESFVSNAEKPEPEEPAEESEKSEKPKEPEETTAEDAE